jgi:hypothetical protein
MIRQGGGEGADTGVRQRRIVEGDVDLGRIDRCEQIANGGDERVELRGPDDVRVEMAIEGAAQERLVDVDATRRRRNIARRQRITARLVDRGAAAVHHEQLAVDENLEPPRGEWIPGGSVGAGRLVHAVRDFDRVRVVGGAERAELGEVVVGGRPGRARREGREDAAAPAEEVGVAS